MLIQRGYRRRLASKHGEYATKEEFEQLVTFQAKTLPTVLGEWKRLHEQAQGSSGAGPVERSSSDQVIPTPSHLLDRILPIFPPFFPIFCAFFTALTRRFQRAASRNPGPRDIGKGAQTPFLRPS